MGSGSGGNASGQIISLLPDPGPKLTKMPVPASLLQHPPPQKTGIEWTSHRKTCLAAVGNAASPGDIRLEAENSIFFGNERPVCRFHPARRADKHWQTT